ncbi:MAG: response regulator [Bacteroidales bacterium]|jgi:DNA-binding NtrC family response regulator|nr:response regulator [Bacteroidales bacterium]
MKSKFKVFIVEDDPFFASILQSNLKTQEDLETTVYSTGEEMVEALSLNPDIVLLDYNLEEMNGLDVLKEIRSFSSDIAVIFISGQAKTDVAVNSLKYGAIHYIVKNDKSITNLYAILDEIKASSSMLERKKKRSIFSRFFN